MPLPPIPGPAAVEVPAVEARVYAELFLRELTLTAFPGQATPAAVVTLPYDYATGEAGPASGMRRIEFADIRLTAEARAAAGKPALLQALGAVLAAVYELYNDPDVLSLQNGGVISLPIPQEPEA